MSLVLIMHLMAFMLIVMVIKEQIISSIKKVIKISNVRLFKDSLVKIIGDIFDSYDSLINLFGGQCQII